MRARPRRICRLHIFHIKYIYLVSAILLHNKMDMCNLNRTALTFRRLQHTKSRLTWINRVYQDYQLKIKRFSGLLTRGIWQNTRPMFKTCQSKQVQLRALIWRHIDEIVRTIASRKFAVAFLNSCDTCARHRNRAFYPLQSCTIDNLEIMGSTDQVYWLQIQQ